jgi:hypothetical protein
MAARSPAGERKARITLHFELPKVGLEVDANVAAVPLGSLRWQLAA